MDHIGAAVRKYRATYTSAQHFPCCRSSCTVSSYTRRYEQTWEGRVTGQKFISGTIERHDRVTPTLRSSWIQRQCLHLLHGESLSLLFFFLFLHPPAAALTRYVTIMACLLAYSEKAFTISTHHWLQVNFISISRPTEKYKKAPFSLSFSSLSFLHLHCEGLPWLQA